MDNKTKLFFTFAIGAISGIAIYKFLSSVKGEEFIESTKEKSMESLNDLKSKIKKKENELSDLLAQLSKENSENQTSI